GASTAEVASPAVPRPRRTQRPEAVPGGRFFAPTARPVGPRRGLSGHLHALGGARLRRPSRVLPGRAAAGGRHLQPRGAVGDGPGRQAARPEAHRSPFAAGLLARRPAPGDGGGPDGAAVAARRRRGAPQVPRLSLHGAGPDLLA